MSRSSFSSSEEAVEAEQYAKSGLWFSRVGGALR